VVTDVVDIKKTISTIDTMQMCDALEKQTTCREIKEGQVYTMQDGLMS